MGKVYNNAIEAAKLVKASDEVKLDIIAKYGLLADAVYGGAGFSLIQNNKETFEPLLADNVINWVLTEKNKPIYKKAVQINPKIAQVFQTKANILKIKDIAIAEAGLNPVDVESFDNIISGIQLFGVEDISDAELEELGYIEEDIDIPIDDSDINFDEYINEEEHTIIDDNNIEDDIQIEEQNKGEDTQKEEQNKEDDTEVDGYDERIHGGYRSQIQSLILQSWESLYGYHVDGKEIVDGFIVPGGAILGTGETIKYEGVLKLDKSKIKIEPNTMSNAIYEEFVLACKSSGVPLIKEVSDSLGDVKPYKYNPLLQRQIASGLIDKQAFKGGWSEYSKALSPFILKKTKELAIIKSKTGSDEEIYRELSGYIVSLMVVNYKANLGTQLRICCGDTSKTKQVADSLVERLRAREKTHKSIAQGKLIVGDSVISETGLTATLTIYQNMEGYQSVPQFMGELLCNLQEGMFKPSLKKMIIGVDLENNIVTAPFTKWLLPIIAGSRSGKGVLTLNMLLNVIGTGTPLFYLDGKPDMAALLWKLGDKYNVGNSMVVDGIGYEGVTEVDQKPYRAPYASSIQKMLASPTSEQILESNYGVMIYLKTMLVILLSTRYYKDQMGSKYGEIFVVFDEVFKVMKTQVEILIMNIDTAIAKLDKSEKERKAELASIKMWIQELLQTYIGNDIGVFGAGIKAVALTQFAQDGQYNVSGFGPAKTFCSNFLLKRGVKLFGRQEGGSGTYGVSREKGDEVKFDLYNKYFHFGIGTEQGNTYNNLKTFKPLLVLNENDCKERTGEDKDGAFTSDMLGRVAMYSDVEQFRQKYFTDPDISEAIGFEGALAQVGRLIGADWREMLKQSLTRSYEIADEALRYYGIIGTDNIESVYDYICSFEIKHLWSYNEITLAKAKGKSLSGEEIASNEETDEQNGNSIFGGMPEFDMGDEDEDDMLDFGDDTLDNSTDNQEESIEPMFGGHTESLSQEEQSIIQDIQSRKNSDNMEEYKDEEEELYTTEDIVSNTEDEFNNLESDFNNSEYTEEKYEEEIDDSYEEIVEDSYTPPKTYNVDDYDTKPEEQYDTEEQVFEVVGRTGKKYTAKPTKTTQTLKLTPENSIIAELSDKHPLEKHERRLLKSLKGANYEFSRRWEAILNAVSKRINSNLVTRVIIVQDEMYVNNRLVSTVNIVGGFENIRLEDIVDFKALFKKFRNISELTLDATMVQRFQIEQPNLPYGFFAYGEKLLKVNILLSNGSKEVIDRNSLSDGQEEPEVIQKARFRNQFESVCAANNPRLKEQSMGYQNTVWKATKTFGGNSWEAVNNQLKKQNPSIIKALSIGTLAIPVVAVGSAIAGIGGLFNLFKNK